MPQPSNPLWKVVCCSTSSLIQIHIYLCTMASPPKNVIQKVAWWPGANERSERNSPVTMYTCSPFFLITPKTGPRRYSLRIVSSELRGTGLVVSPMPGWATCIFVWLVLIYMGCYTVKNIISFSHNFKKSMKLLGDKRPWRSIVAPSYLNKYLSHLC